MATNHIPRLLRLARRTGDRLIVTDEQGGGEPMVILPLDEYEGLIDQAFGPSSMMEMEESGVEASIFPQTQPIRKENPGRSEESEAIAGTDVTIELDDVALLEGIEVDEAFDDEAEIDEAALIDLWKEPTAAREEARMAEKVEIEEKQKEVEQNKPVRAGGGEEQFYLEPID